MRHTCDIYASTCDIHENICRMYAACMSHVCRMSVAYMSHVCRIYAACMSHICRIQAHVSCRMLHYMRATTCVFHATVLLHVNTGMPRHIQYACSTHIWRGCLQFNPTTYEVLSAILQALPSSPLVHLGFDELSLVRMLLNMSIHMSIHMLYTCPIWLGLLELHRLRT